ncbi:unnamed protein product [Rotaria sp. Silwood2]|nr:unnamed protein product [Rotaria sp. Silwood2]CAF4551949.1 unnamed protein product [Rotaria sp. Silwood2]
MVVILFLVCLTLAQTTYTTASKSVAHGIEVATRMGNRSRLDATESLTNQPKWNFGSLQFQFSSPTYNSNWWCVKMFETTSSWQDNYLCTNENIGLTWMWDNRACYTGLKCVATAEPADNRWHDNALCLPVDSNIELVWSYCGRLSQMNCIQLYDPAAPGYTHDNHLCWKEH